MKMCQPHWDRLKQAIRDRGLGDLVAADGKEALAQIIEQLEGKPQTIEKFDPLMGAYWAIINNAMEMIKNIGQNPLMLMSNDPAHPEWECPICCLNWLSADHDKHCTEAVCCKPKGLTFDDWIDKAADGIAEVAQEKAKES